MDVLDKQQWLSKLANGNIVSLNKEYITDNLDDVIEIDESLEETTLSVGEHPEFYGTSSFHVAGVGLALSATLTSSWRDAPPCGACVALIKEEGQDIKIITTPLNLMNVELINRPNVKVSTKDQNWVLITPYTDNLGTKSAHRNEKYYWVLKTLLEPTAGQVQAAAKKAGKSRATAAGRGRPPPLVGRTGFLEVGAQRAVDTRVAEHAARQRISAAAWSKTRRREHAALAAAEDAARKRISAAGLSETRRREHAALAAAEASGPPSPPHDAGTKGGGRRRRTPNKRKSSKRKSSKRKSSKRKSRKRKSSKRKSKRRSRS